MPRVEQCEVCRSRLPEESLSSPPEKGHPANCTKLRSNRNFNILLVERNAEITAWEVFDAGIICVDADSWHFEEFM